MKFSNFLTEALTVSDFDRGYGNSGEDRAYQCVHMLKLVSQNLERTLRNADFSSALENNFKDAKRAERDNDDCLDDIRTTIKLSKDILKKLKSLASDFDKKLAPLTKKYGWVEPRGRFF